MITLFTGMLISAVVEKIIGLKNAESLAAFVPVILAMGGNTGMQASAVTIRSIALGEIGLGKLFVVFIREILVGFIMGAVCGVIVAVAVYSTLHLFSSELSQPPLKLSFIISVSMCVAMTFAAVTGSVMPIFLNQLKIDPAVASGPFVTTGNDLSASLIYFFMCYILLSI
jgi:magnesium transporter